MPQKPMQILQALARQAPIGGAPIRLELHWKYSFEGKAEMPCQELEVPLYYSIQASIPPSFVQQAKVFYKGIACVFFQEIRNLQI